MKYICQISDGYMLAKHDYYKDKLVIEFTGYPYPNVEKSHVEMMQSLLKEERGLNYSIDLYHDIFPYIKNFLLRQISIDNYMIAIDDLCETIEKAKTDPSIIKVTTGTYCFIEVPDEDKDDVIYGLYFSGDIGFDIIQMDKINEYHYDTVRIPFDIEDRRSRIKFINKDDYEEYNTGVEEAAYWTDFYDYLDDNFYDEDKSPSSEDYDRISNKFDKVDRSYLHIKHDKNFSNNMLNVLLHRFGVDIDKFRLSILNPKSRNLLQEDFSYSDNGLLELKIALFGED